MNGRMVYVLVPSAIYDQGVIGVYATLEDAQAAAEEIWPTTDGHHDMLIYPRAIGATQPDVFLRRYDFEDRAPGPLKMRVER